MDPRIDEIEDRIYRISTFVPEINEPGGDGNRRGYQRRSITWALHDYRRRRGQRRLNLLAEIMQPTTLRLLQEAGLRGGDRCLDLGCGGGNVVLDTACASVT